MEQKKKEMKRFFSLKKPVEEPKGEVVQGPPQKIEKMRLAAGGRAFFPQINHSEVNVSYYDKTQMFYASVKPYQRKTSLSYFCSLDEEGRRNMAGATLSTGQMIDPQEHLVQQREINVPADALNLTMWYTTPLSSKQHLGTCNNTWKVAI